MHLFIGKSNNREVPNLEMLRKHLLREGRLEKKELMEIVQGATNIMSKYFLCSFIICLFRERAKCIENEGASHHRRRYSWVVL